MLDFCKSGKFDQIKLGQTKEWISNHFPEPDSRFSKQLLKGGFDVWTYGDIELHFEGQELIMIYADHLKAFSGGEKLKIDKWIFENTSSLSLVKVAAELDNNHIDYKQKEDNLGILLRLSSGVELTFENLNDVAHLSTSEFCVTSIGLVKENPNRWK